MTAERAFVLTALFIFQFMASSALGVEAQAGNISGAITASIFSTILCSLFFVVLWRDTDV